MSYVFAPLSGLILADRDDRLADRYRDVRMRTYVFAAVHEIAAALDDGKIGDIGPRIAEFDRQTLGECQRDGDVLASQVQLWFSRLDRAEFHARFSAALGERLRAGLLRQQR